MENFLPVLDTVQTRLREILARNRDGITSWNLTELRHVGDDLLRLSLDTYSQLAHVEHRILYQSLREAGLGIKMRVTLIERGNVREDDKEYFESVYQVLLNICQKIESGEYYRALLDIANKRRKEKREEEG